MTTLRPFRILGLQQIALGTLDKTLLKALWVDRLGLAVTGHFTSEKENVDEDSAPWAAARMRSRWT